LKIFQLNSFAFHLGYPAITRCLLLESREGLVLVDAGIGLRDFLHPNLRFRVFFAGNRGNRDPEQAVIRQIIRLGYDPQDVHHFVLTHLHLDHAGGIQDFPWAKVHVYRLEHSAATSGHKQHLLEYGYEPHHWAHDPDWALYETQDEPWFGLPCARVLEIEDTQILLVPVPGHTRGHCGVAISTSNGWLLHAGDAYVRDMQIDPLQPRSAFPGFGAWFEGLLFPLQGRILLQKLLKSAKDQVQVFCAHDPHSKIDDAVVAPLF